MGTCERERRLRKIMGEGKERNRERERESKRVIGRGKRQSLGKKKVV